MCTFLCVHVGNTVEIEEHSCIYWPFIAGLSTLASIIVIILLGVIILLARYC